jgi:hypothetical protein
MRYAAVYKLNSEPLDRFVKRTAASTPARLGFLGVWGEGQLRDPKGG